MIRVTVLDNGDVRFWCSECDDEIVLGYDLHTSPFWDVYVGQTLLGMLGHELTHRQPYAKP